MFEVSQARTFVDARVQVIYGETSKVVLELISQSLVV